MDHGAVVADAVLALSDCLGMVGDDTHAVKFSNSGNVLVSLRTEDARVIAKLCRGGYPYEAGIYEVLATERLDGPVAPRLLGQCDSPNGFGRWLFCEMGTGVSGDHVRENLSRYLAKLRHIHRVPAAPFKAALPGRYGRMGRRQWSRQLATNLEMIARFGDRLGIAVAVDPADWRERLEWMAEIRYSAPVTPVHGDACLDNWIIVQEICALSIGNWPGSTTRSWISRRLRSS